MQLVSNTNADYLSKNNLENLYIDELSIMDYDCVGKEKCIEKLTIAGAMITHIEDHYIYVIFNEMKIIYCIDWPKHIQLRERRIF